jgi:hypothetical protein
VAALEPEAKARPGVAPRSIAPHGRCAPTRLQLSRTCAREPVGAVNDAGAHLKASNVDALSCLKFFLLKVIEFAFGEVG